MKILIVRKDTLEITCIYEAAGIDQRNFGGPNGDPLLTTHIQCSDLIDAECASVEMQSGVMVAVLDEDKVAAKTERLWDLLRAKRDAKLAECDWTQLPDSPLYAQDKESWSEYRQALRDLPEHTEDPANPEWPAKPSVEA